jgi:anti-sigma factor RsiW
MTCATWERDVALYAGGDLPAARIAEVELHLAGCADCRALLEDLRAERALLEEISDAQLEASLAAEVRTRVLERLAETAAGSTGWSYWKWALVAALLLVALLLPYGWRGRQAARVARLPKPAPMISQVEPAPRAPIVAANQRVRRRRHPAHVEPVMVAQTHTPLLVKFVTSDPDIVIYWLVDQKGEKE